MKTWPPKKSNNFEKHTETPEDTLHCVFVNDARRCMLLGTIGSGGRFYCAWHYHSLADASKARDRASFDEFLDRERKMDKNSPTQFDGADEVIWQRSLGNY